MKNNWRRILSLILIFGLLFQQTCLAQLTTELNLTGSLSALKPPQIQDRFRPLELRYFSYDSLTDNFNVLVDKGDARQLNDAQAADQTKALIKYFLIGVSLNDDSFWVNLRPDAKNHIIDQDLEKTDIGKVMLETDLQLKQDLANLTSPLTSAGKEYWSRLYKKAEELYGHEDVIIPTLTRPWIVPGEIIIRESRQSAYIYKATLKVMLEEDYIKNSNTFNLIDDRAKELNSYSAQLIRKLIIPKLIKEVNSNKNYACLRQVYYSLILSRWFKTRYAGKSGSYAALINTRNLTNLVSQKPWSKTTYFKRYQESFSKGKYDIQESFRTPTGQTIRSYFSGGEDLTGNTMLMPTSTKQMANGNIGLFTNSLEIPLIPTDKAGLISLQGDGGSFLSSISGKISQWIRPEPEPNSPVPEPELNVAELRTWHEEASQPKKLTLPTEFSVEELRKLIKNFSDYGLPTIENYLEKHGFKPFAPQSLRGQIIITNDVVDRVVYCLVNNIAVPLIENEYTTFDEREFPVPYGDTGPSTYTVKTPIDTYYLTAPDFPWSHLLKNEFLELNTEIRETITNKQPLSLKKLSEKLDFNDVLRFVLFILDEIQGNPSEEDIKELVNVFNLNADEQAIIVQITEIRQKEISKSSAPIQKGQASLDINPTQPIQPISEPAVQKITKFPVLAGKDSSPQNEQPTNTAETHQEQPAVQTKPEKKIESMTLSDADIQKLVETMCDNFFNYTSLRALKTLSDAIDLQSLKRLEKALSWRGDVKELVIDKGVQGLVNCLLNKIDFDYYIEYITRTSQEGTNKQGYIRVTLTIPETPKRSKRVKKAKNSPAEQNAPQKTGGIDFKALPITTQLLGSFTGLSPKLPQLPQEKLKQVDITSEVAKIQNMLQIGVMPSGQRIKELIAACLQKNQLSAQAENLLFCIAAILKLEEENASESASELKEALVLVDSQG